MNKKIKDLTFMSICMALLIVCSKISFNIGPIPITLQTFGVITITLILKVKKSLIVFFSYIIIGLIGIPVFSNGGGYSYILMPSFGFIIGFFLQAIVTGISKKNTFFFNSIKSVLGLLIIDVVGLLYMYLILNYYYEYNKSVIYVLEAGFFPFFLKDIISVVLASLIYNRICVPLNIEVYKNKSSFISK